MTTSGISNILPTLLLTTATVLTTTTTFINAQPENIHKYKFFCGSSFADIQSDTCSQRQWCPSSSDDECLVPGHTCFANTPCDAREIEDISVPTYSLSLHPEYRDPTDKMFCGVDYADASETCQAGGDEAMKRHCPDMKCPDGLVCFIELPCSYFVMTDPLANPLSNIDEIEITEAELDLPKPGSLESNYFCGPTFQQAAASCSSQTWCRTGTSQECPNGETCFVSVDIENSECEINAIVKKEYGIAKEEAAAEAALAADRPAVPTVPTIKPTNMPLAPNSPKMKSFCGIDWEDANDHCVLDRHCPNGNEDCPEGMECFEYTNCHANGLTYMPTKSPTPLPTNVPTPSPIHTTPTQRPTTAKPSRMPTPPPSGVPTPKPTGVPSKKPTHSPLAFGDFRREFWCGLTWFDAMENCPLKCPSGGDEECPNHPDGRELKCLSGVSDCKNERGLDVYLTKNTTETQTEGGVDTVFEETGSDVLVTDEVINLDNSSPTKPPTETFYNLEDKETTADRPKPTEVVVETEQPEVEPAEIAKAEAEETSSSTLTITEDASSNLAVDDSSEVGEPVDKLPLQGPFEEELVRIILYGLDSSTMLSSPTALQRWKSLTTKYFTDFFNEYPTQEMLNAGSRGPDTIRNSVYDVNIEIIDELMERAPVHDFDSMVVHASPGMVRADDGHKRNLRSSNERQTQVQAGIDSNKVIMITYSQTTKYRSSLVVINDDPNLIVRRPLETPEYRAEYVSYLRSVDFDLFGDLEYVSRFLYTDFPTASPTGKPTSKPSVSPVIPGQPTLPPQTDAPITSSPTGGPPTSHPTDNLACNLCLPGQYGVNANVIFNGEVSTCMEIYNYFLMNARQGSGVCREGQEALSNVCCSGEGNPVPPPTNKPIVSLNVEPKPVEPKPAPQPLPAIQPQEPLPAEIEIPVDENGLPDAVSLSETYYCGLNWDSVSSNCDTATPCPSGDNSVCPGSEQCIAFTNCGGKFSFVSDPSIEGGGPNPDEVKSTFYCGSSMQFLEMNCDGATPCPNGPEDCSGEGENFGCFAFTGCNEQVDPGKFVGFLAPPDEQNTAVATAPAGSVASTMFCASSWSELDSQCVDGVPQGATPCPSGDILECGDGQGCFAFACGNGVGSIPVASPSISSGNKPTGDYSVEDMDLLKSTFFCGTSVKEIDGDCENALPCPSGDECPEGYGCFAFSQCGGVDIDSLVDTFGETDRPTRAPTVPIEQVCDEDQKMSVNVGYWQSWSIYRDETCQRMNTASFDASPYTHVVYSFASIDSSFRLEAWNGTYDNEVPLYKEFNTVKQRHPGTKTMIAVGGWTHNDPGPMQKRFSQMASSKSNRQVFANSVVQFLRTYGFDGLDLDWEYPGLKERGGKREDYDNYVLMVKDIRNAFNAAPEPYELTVAITGNVTKLEMGFDFEGLAEHVDWFNIMAYDLWGSWDPRKLAYSHTDLRMIDEAVDYISHFIQRSKLVMGLGSYARTYTLADSNCLDLGCPFEGPGKSGCQGTEGFLPYFEIADLVISRNYDTVRFDDESQSMVMVTDGNRLISYDNTVSFNRKIQYAEEMCMKGKMLWAIDMLKDGSNPLSSNNGNTLATGDASDQSFCGTSYQDVISGCKQPCPSGNSNQCPGGEQCFANTGCSIDNIGAPPPTKCRLCPDPSTQGMKDWLEVEYEGETMTCGDADMAVLSDFVKGTEQCDSAKQTLGATCCYNYADTPCSLCRSETDFMDLRALAEIEYKGETISCGDLNKRLGPDESDSDICLDAQKEHWDTCCYNQCTLCEGQGVKWWDEVDYEEEPLNCGELDAKLYAEQAESEDDTCKDILSEFKSECCYDFPTNPCDVCTSNDGKKHTLMPSEEVEYDGSTFSCAEVNNFLSPFESTSDQCMEVKELSFETCCFDRCSLCGQGARLDPEVLVEIESGADGETEQGSCADIESGLFQSKTTDSSTECTEARTLHYDACCFEIPSTPCQLCPTDQYLHHTTTIEFNDEEVTCRSASNFLMEREDITSDTCSEAKATLADTCCYEICDMCGEYDLDWDVFINHEGKDMSCGDFNEIFREKAIVDGTQQCDAFKNDYFDTCCYSSPTTSCQLCKQGDTFFDLNDDAEVDFNGPTTCFEVANFLSRRLQDTDPVCAVTQSSLFDECCYSKCNLANKAGTYPDWSAEVEMDGNVATCLEIENAIKDAAIPTGSSECQSLQDAFSPTCSYSIPMNACDLCPTNSVSIQASAQWKGKEMMCSDIKSSVSSREEADSEVCLNAQRTLQDSCCIDQCEICEKSMETDFAMTVYHNGVTMPCTDVDNHFYEKSILASSDECSAAKSDYSQCCYTAPKSPCNLCRQGSEYFDLLGQNSVTYMGQKMTCTDASDMMFRREEEDGDMCSSVRDEIFDTCCDTKCSLCSGKGLEAGVKVSFEGRMMTCLELDLSLGPAAIISGTEQCNAITSQHSEDCCYEKPENSCRICPGDNVGVNKEVSVNYLGTETTCDSLSNYLGSREEQQGQACQAASSDHANDCCFEHCSLCGDGKADWETFVTYEGQSIACGDFEWILRGKSVAAGSDQCNAVKTEFFDKCCYEPPETSCNLCHVENDYLDVSAEAQVYYQGSQMKCISLYNSLFVREAADSDQCQDAKDAHAQDCCFEKCNMCKVGYLDTTATVRVEGVDMSCSALDMSFSKDVVMEGSEQCNEHRSQFSDACCYTIPDNPCKVCPAGSDVYGDVSVDFYGETKSCADIGNKLAVSEEASSETCSSTQRDFADACCFERCPICPEGYNLNWGVDVEYNRGTVACGEFDSIIRGNAINKGSEECSSIRSTYSSACCYNYATNQGYADETTLASVTTSGYLSTNLDVSGLSPEEKEEAKKLFAIMIESTLQSQDALPPASTVTVKNIDANGVVHYEIDMYIDDAVAGIVESLAIDPLDTDAAIQAIADALSNPLTLTVISEGIKEEAAGSIVSDELSDAIVQGSVIVGEPLVTSKGDVIEVEVNGKLDTNIVDTSNLTPTQKEEVKEVVEQSLQSSLQSEGVLPQESTVTVKDIDDGGDVSYEIELSIGNDSPSGDAITTLEVITDALVNQIDTTLSKDSTLETISSELQDDLPGLTIDDFIQGETSVASTGSTATGSGPCNLCKAGEIGLDKEILFNGAQTSCPEVYKFLSTQAEAGSNACLAGKEALHDECCMTKCDLCSGGGIPDWYSMVNINGNSMTCLELDSIITESEIQSGGEQCNQLLGVAASACCYEPPSEPCNLCQHGSESFDVMSSVTVDYGGTTATCGEIFNTLFSREEKESETCSLIKQDLASQCCYNKCSLCGGLQTNAELSVTHDETQLGCSEFDSYIFASNLIEEGSNECKAFQDEHRSTCCYDIACSLCSKGDEIYTTKETSVVQYGGSETTCGEVANFLYQQEMSQGNACLAAQENILSDCCFQQCELCEAGATINWAATTSFNGLDQSCTDVYWTLVSESVEAGTQTCNAMSQVSSDCCYKVPSQQCTLCKDDNGANYNTRWNKEVTVNGMKKTCGDFNTLLATQEKESQTCSMAKDAIFNECCFAGSDTLVAIANQASTESDAPCNLCQPGQVGISGDIVFNNSPTTCEEVYNFLIDSFKESETTCKSAQVKLAEDCCREQDKLSPSEKPAFGVEDNEATAIDESGQGSITAEKTGEKVTPPLEFDSWTRFNEAKGTSSSILCFVVVPIFAAYNLWS